MLTEIEEKIAFRLWDLGMKDSIVESVITDLEDNIETQQEMLEWLYTLESVTTTEILEKVDKLFNRND